MTGASRMVSVAVTLLCCAVASTCWAANKPDPQHAIDTLRDFSGFMDSGPWGEAIFELIDSGRAGVPTMLAELRDTDATRLQRTIPIALAQIGDRRAVPFLIHALARCRVDAGNNGLSVPDAEIYWRLRELLNPPVPDRYGSIDDERPDQVITKALEKLTGHHEVKWHLDIYADDGQWPKTWGEPTHERERQTKRQMAELWWTWWARNKSNLLSPDELKWDAANAPKGLQQPPASSSRTIVLHVKDFAGKPLAHCAVDAWADREHYVSETDANGNLSQRLPNEAKQVSFTTEAPSLVPTTVLWSPEQKMPDSYDLTLQHAVKTEGIVKDPDGKPIAGASVCLIAPKTLDSQTWADVSCRIVVTDANGKWSASILPESAKNVRVKSWHDDYAASDQKARLADLEAGKFETILEPLVTLQGVVSDDSSKPMAGAKVTALSQEFWAHDYPSVTTDAAGHFAIPHVKAEALHLAVQASDFAPVVQSIKLAPRATPAPMQIHLNAGRHLSGRLVDSKDRPLANAIVQCGPIAETLLVDWHARTDADGHFDWPHAPSDATALELFKSGFDTAITTAKAGESSLTIKLHPIFTASGRVVDAQTGGTIRKFTLIPGVLTNTNTKMLWRNMQKNFDGGTYSHSFPQSHVQDFRERAQRQYFLRIEADGHLPVDTPIFGTDGDSPTFDLALPRGEEVTGKVIGADGAPVKDAEVLLATPFQTAEVYDGKRSTGGGPERNLYAPTDAQGRFKFRPQAEAYEILVLHPSGYARITREQFLAGDKTLKLQPWGRIEGTVSKNGKLVRAEMSLTNDYFSLPSSAIKVQPFTSLRADKDGHFVFARVMAGNYRLSAESHSQGAMSYSGPGIPLEVKSGASAHVDFGANVQRTVIGNVTLADETTQIDWSKQKLKFGPPPDENPKAATKPTSQPTVEVPIAPDGSFKIENVHSGNWQIMLEGMLPPEKSDPSGRERKINGGVAFEMAGGDNTPLDLGDISLHVMRAPLKAGMTAPQIEAPSLDGKTFKLSDHAGKYVLLDFWATWCGPCRGETPNLKAVREAFRNDNRLVMVGISSDFDKGEAIAYTRENQMDWTQAYVGFSQENPAAGEYGVTGIPTIFLVAPDGKVLADNLRGDKMVETIRGLMK